MWKVCPLGEEVDMETKLAFFKAKAFFASFSPSICPRLNRKILRVLKKKRSNMEH